MNEEYPPVCAKREVCVDGGCKLLGRLAAAGLDPEEVIGAARRAAHLPYEQCADGVQTSKPERDGRTWRYCGQRREVRDGAEAIAEYWEARAARAESASGAESPEPLPLVQQP